MKFFSANKGVKGALLTLFSLTIAVCSVSCGQIGNNADKETDAEETKMEYSFMNCDTGRMLTVGDNIYFEIEETDGKKSLKTDDGSYVKFDKTGAKKTTDKAYIELKCENGYERYQIATDDGVLYDNDLGTDNSASLALAGKDDKTLKTGWYMTKKGDKLPIKFTVYGDSISNGVNPDNPAGEDHTGCRKELSSLMLEKYGRAVAVGSSRVSDGNALEKDTYLTDGFMYRHEGHNGWVITSHEGYAEVNNYGIDTLRENLQKKYAPDVICMMIGINDVNQLVPLFIANDTDGVRSDLVDRWLKLVKSIFADLPKDGVLVCGTVTPMRNSPEAWNNIANSGVEAFNTCIYESVETFKNRGETRMTVSDNYNAVKGVGLNGISSDNGHLSIDGYSAMAKSYFKAITEYYGG